MERELNEKVIEILEKEGLDSLPTTLREAELGDRRFLLPSFAVANLRGMKVAEENAVTSRKKNRDGEGVNEVLKNCTHGEPIIDWLIGDRTFALLQIKRLSHGDWYDFKVSCPHCREMIHWSEDLGGLKVQYLQEPGKTDGFEVELPISERKLKYRLLDGKDERKISKLRKNADEEMQAALMLFRTTEIEGERMKTMKFFNELEAMDRIAFTEHMDEHDCGVHTTIEVECDSCFARFETDLPMGLDFFLPRKTSSKR